MKTANITNPTLLSEHEIEGKKVVVMREDDIACVIEDSQVA